MERIKALFQGRLRFAVLVLLAALLCVGTFHTDLSCALSLALLCDLAFCLVRRGRISFRWNLTGSAILSIFLGYGVTVFWAVDPGMAFTGLLKFLPVPLYLLVLMQEEDTEDIVQSIPCAAVVMTVLSAAAMQIPALRDSFSVSDRLAGFFQYPNTFALLLLTAELILISKEKLRIVDFVMMATLIFGLLYTGSRTAFVLAALLNLVALFFGKGRRGRIFGAAGIVLAVLAAVIYTVATGNTTVFSRFLTISLQESTFVGRLLYAWDALPVILKHPFGLGYMGYYYLQQSAQSGVYSVLYIHNDILQLFLDVGWVPAGLFLAAIGKGIFRRGISFRNRLVLSAILLHSLFDFNLQFIGMVLVLLLFLPREEGKEVLLEKKAPFLTAAGVMALLCVTVGVALGLNRAGLTEAAQTLYPWNTQNEIALLLEQEDLDLAGRTADHILARNSHVTVAHSVKARQAYAKGDFGELIQIKNEIFTLAPFAYDEYEEYCYMLINGVALYRQAGDEASADFCLQELYATRDRVAAQAQRLSSLGAAIKDQPTLELPADILDYLARAERGEI